MLEDVIQESIINDKFSIKLVANKNPTIEHFVKIMRVYEFYLHMAFIKKYSE